MSAPSEGDRVLVQVEATYRGTYDIDGREFVYVYDDEGGTYSLPQAVAVSVITPPKPAEPTGLGAVVEDANGSQYVRLATKDDAPWHLQPEGPIGFNAHPYHEIDAVRVLSEGVEQP